MRADRRLEKEGKQLKARDLGSKPTDTMDSSLPSNCRYFPQKEEIGSENPE